MKRALLVICLMTALAASACGYGFRGRINNLPSDLRTISIPVFVNNTGEVRIESIFTDEVIFQFTRSQQLRVVNQGQADCVLRGRINRVDIEDVAYTAQETSSQRRITITVDAKLTRSSDGSVLWHDPELRQRRTYNVGSNPQSNETNKAAAISALARQMAETLHDRVFENF